MNDAARVLQALHDETSREVLPNGLTLLIRRDTSAPVVAIVTHVTAGYFDEPDDVVGIAHVLEHMYFKGTPTRGVGAIARETKGHGGVLNAHTIYDHTSYYTVVPSAAFAAGLDIQFDAYAHSTIDADELARELEVIIQEAKRKRDTPSAVALETLYAVLHDRHRIRRWRIGEEAGLRALTRDHLLGFYRTWYQPSNTILSIVGDVDPETVRRAVHARYGQLANVPTTRDRGPLEVTPPGFRVREWTGDIAQQHMAFGWRAPALHHADAPALELGSMALASGRASRFYRAIRERQLASSISAWHYTTDTLGLFVAYADAPVSSARDAAQAMWRELQTVRHEGVRADEVRRAQRILEARWMRRLETMDGQATYLASWEAEGGLECATAYYDRLLAYDATRVSAALTAQLDPAQASIVSYRPTSADPLAPDAATLERWLQAVTLHRQPSTSEAGGHEAVVSMPSPDATVHTNAHVVSHDWELTDGVHVTTLPGGIPLLVLPRPGTPLVSLGVFQRGGACLTAPEDEGLARVAATLLLKGTATRTASHIAEATEELGGGIGVSAGLESLGWSLSVPTRHLAAATAILADVLQYPTFPDEAIATERTLSLAELARQRDDMGRWPMRLASLAAYHGHPYARSLLGTDEALVRVDAARLAAFHRAHILRAASVIAVVGDVVPDEVAQLMARAFPALTVAADPALPMAHWPAEAITTAESRDKQQTALAWLFPGPRRDDPMRFAAQVLSAITSGLGGRFFEALRDRQSLAYTVSAFNVERRAGGAFGAYIATSPAREDEARAGLLREFTRLRTEPPTAEEVRRAQQYLIGTHVIGQQSAGAVLGEVVDAWLFGRGLDERSAYPSAIAQVTPEDVLAIATTYLDPARVVEGVVRGTRVA